MFPNSKVGLQIADLVHYSSFCGRLRTFVLATEADFDVSAIDHVKGKTDELAYSVH